MVAVYVLAIFDKKEFYSKKRILTHYLFINKYFVYIKGFLIVYKIKTTIEVQAGNPLLLQKF